MNVYTDLEWGQFVELDPLETNHTNNYSNINDLELMYYENYENYENDIGKCLEYDDSGNSITRMMSNRLLYHFPYVSYVVISISTMTLLSIIL